jgi:hypothetical protein
MQVRRMTLGNERGAAIALVAISLTAVLGMAALAIDISMLMKARGDAQRAADAAALAGASVFIDVANVTERLQNARDRALRFAALNHVNAVLIDTMGAQVTAQGPDTKIRTNEVVVTYRPLANRVHVVVRRQSIGTFFGRILGSSVAAVSAMAEAEATDAGGAKCVKPFALSDPWADADDDTNGNRIWDDGEDWDFDPADGDTYRPWQYTGDNVYTGDSTGYGSTYRNLRPDGSTITGDYGRQLVIKPQDPGVDQTLHPGNFFIWDMPIDSTNTSDCGIGGGGGGATSYSTYICSCNNNQINVYADTFTVEPGNKKGPTKEGFKDLLALDPSAYWDPALNGGRGAVAGSNATNWMESERVIKVGLFDPLEVEKSGKIEFQFNNIALMFVEDYSGVGGGDDAVTARFITYAQGSASPGPSQGSLVKQLRLVK